MMNNSYERPDVEQPRDGLAESWFRRAPHLSTNSTSLGWQHQASRAGAGQPDVGPNADWADEESIDEVADGWFK